MKLAELLFDVPAYYGETHDQKYLEKGIIVEILSEYQDYGFWSEDNGEIESPFPAYEFRYEGLTYCSVHINCFEHLDV